MFLYKSSEMSFHRERNGSGRRWDIGGGNGRKKQEHKIDRSTRMVRDVVEVFFLKCSHILVCGWCILDLSALCLFLISSFLPLSKHNCVNRDFPPTWIHLVSTSFRSRSVSVGLDQSILIEPDSTFPVRPLNKLVQLCLTPHFISPLPRSPTFPPFPPCIPHFISSLFLKP